MSETVAVQKSSSEAVKKEKAERRAAFKEQALKDPDSVFLLPFGGSKGTEFIYHVMNLDRAINNIKRKAVFGIPITEVKAVIEEIGEVGEKMWGLVRKHVPRLYDCDRFKWRMLNDSYEEKRFLAERRNLFWLIPRSEEIGQIAVAMKIIHKQCIALQHDDIDAYGNLIADYVGVIEKIKSLHDKVEQRLLKK